MFPSNTDGCVKETHFAIGDLGKRNGFTGQRMGRKMKTMDFAKRVNLLGYKI